MNRVHYDADRALLTVPKHPTAKEKKRIAAHFRNAKARLAPLVRRHRGAGRRGGICLLFVRVIGESWWKVPMTPLNKADGRRPAMLLRFGTIEEANT